MLTIFWLPLPIKLHIYPKIQRFQTWVESNKKSELSPQVRYFLFEISRSFVGQIVKSIFLGNKEITTRPNSQVFHGNSYSQPYRFGGRVGLFGHYLRSLKIILLLTSIKLDASRKKFNQKVVDQILRGICDLASGIEAVERKYVKKGQRLLFCGPDLLQLGVKCLDLQHAFDALLQGRIHNRAKIHRIPDFTWTGCKCAR